MMKRIISSLIIAVMLVSMFSFMTSGVSANQLISTYEDAKNGDLLCELKFGETTGIYAPDIIRAMQEEDVFPEKAATVSDNGRTLSFIKPSILSGTFFYGGKIDGLTWGEGKTYTITMKLSLPQMRGGVFFNFPTDATKQEYMNGKTVIDNRLYETLYGIYGRFNLQGDLGAMKGANRINGQYRFDTSSYKEFDTIIVEEGTPLDVVIVISDYSYTVFINDLFIDVIYLESSAVKDVCDNLGFSVFMYHMHENEPVVVKDVNIYKGDLISSKAHYPSYVKGTTCHCGSDHAVTSPVVTKPPVSTLPSVTTTAAPYETVTVEDSPKTTPEITTAEVTTIRAYVNTMQPKNRQEGCSSAVTSGVALISLASLAGVAVIRKRK